jgi:hypothetical protein
VLIIGEHHFITLILVITLHYYFIPVLVVINLAIFSLLLKFALQKERMD